jgi:octopine/nopaline transport system substrate-binding protein
MNRSKILALVMAAVTLFASGSALAQDKHWSKIRIATEGAFRPWNFTEPDGKLNGFEIDLYQDLCARMKVECEMSAQSFDGMIPALNAGKFDAIMAGMSATPKREEVITFSISYGTTGQSFGTLKSGPVTALPGQGEIYSLDSNEAGALKAIEALKPVLQGKVIGVQTASIAASFIDKYLKGVVEVREYKTTEQHDLDLLAGRVDLIMASMAYLSGVAAKPDFADMAIVGPRFQGGILGRGSSVGLRKSDPELKTMFDAAITAAKADGTIQRLSQKWFGFDVTPR